MTKNHGALIVYQRHLLHEVSSTLLLLIGEVMCKYETATDVVVALYEEIKFRKKSKIGLFHFSTEMRFSTFQLLFVFVVVVFFVWWTKLHLSIEKNIFIIFVYQGTWQ